MTNVKCTTDLCVTRSSTTTFTWIIKNIGNRVGEYSLERILSNEFTVKETDGRETKWVLEILPNVFDYSLCGRGDDNSFKVLIHNKNADTIKTNIKVYFLDRHDEPKETVSHIKKISADSFLQLCKHSWKSLADQNIIPPFNRRSLTIVCEITILVSTISSVGPEGSQSSTAKCPSSLLEKGYQTFSKSFSQFHLSKEMSDVQIQCEDQTFDAHQVILAARSPVFRAMFQAEMKEKESRQVEILDLKAKVIPDMLKYIYNGSCCVNDKKPDLEMVSDLLGAADKYQMDILKEMCENVLSSSLVIDNALRLLSLADMHSANDLKKNALDMIVTNAKKITGTEEWRDCARDRPHLLIVVAEALAASKK